MKVFKRSRFERKPCVIRSDVGLALETSVFEWETNYHYYY